MEERIGCLVTILAVSGFAVLILIVVEERIGSNIMRTKKYNKTASLNPYCSGRKNRIFNMANTEILYTVLILIVVEERIGYKHKRFRYGKI